MVMASVKRSCKRAKKQPCLCVCRDCVVQTFIIMSQLLGRCVKHVKPVKGSGTYL